MRVHDAWTLPHRADRRATRKPGPVARCPVACVAPCQMLLIGGVPPAAGDRAGTPTEPLRQSPATVTTPAALGPPTSPPRRPCLPSTRRPASPRSACPNAIDAGLAAMGFAQPFMIQTAAIPVAMEGRDVCGRARTGSGKTLALRRADDGPDHRRRRLRAGRSASCSCRRVSWRSRSPRCSSRSPPTPASVCSPCTAAPAGRTRSSSCARGVEIVVATPLRLIDLIKSDEVSLGSVQVVVLDEADRMADDGFTPQVEWILRHCTARRQTMLFSATLDGDVAHLIRHYLRDPVEVAIDAATDTVGTMHHVFLAVHHMDKDRVVAAIGQGIPKLLVFCQTKRLCDKVAASLQDLGVDAAAIHGDLPQVVARAGVAALRRGQAEGARGHRRRGPRHRHRRHRRGRSTTTRRRTPRTTSTARAARPAPGATAGRSRSSSTTSTPRCGSCSARCACRSCRRSRCSATTRACATSRCSVRTSSSTPPCPPLGSGDAGPASPRGSGVDRVLGGFGRVARLVEADHAHHRRELGRVDRERDAAVADVAVVIGAVGDADGTDLDHEVGQLGDREDRLDADAVADVVDRHLRLALGAGCCRPG